MQTITPFTGEESVSDFIKKLRPKQIKFFKEYIKTGNATRSYMKAYRMTNRIVAKSCANTLMQRYPGLKEAIYEEAGLTYHDVAVVIKDAMSANKQTIYKSKVYEFPDHYARLKAVEVYDKTLNSDKEREQKGGNIQVLIVNNPTKREFAIEGEEVK